MVFLFPEELGDCFITEFSQRQPRMMEFLEELEETAIYSDRMNKGAKISSVTGSSVGVVGGVLSIIGLALIPVTAGVSLALTMTGVGLGITSGVNSAVTTATEIGVNLKHKKKASEIFKSFMEDVQCLQDCLEVSARETMVDVALGGVELLGQAGIIPKNVDSLVDCATAVNVLKAEELLANAGQVAVEEGSALRNVPRVASDIPEIGQAAVKGPLAVSRSARVGLIALNALFIGVDIAFICKDSFSLAKGSETELSGFLRARATLWRSEIDSWQKISNALGQGRLSSERNQAIIETPFEEWTQHRRE